MDRNQFPSNSKTTTEREKIKPIITSSVVQQKKGIFKKAAENFLEDTTQSVGQYILYDVIIPTAKTMISEMIGGGIEMLLFGDKGRGRNSNIIRDRGRSHVSYNTMYSQDRNRRTEISPSVRSQHVFDDIIFNTRGEAENVLSHLADAILEYGQATVADLLDLCGLQSKFTDAKYGWTDLRQTVIRRVNGGYLLELPKTRPLE
jgi:hypothetical protein